MNKKVNNFKFLLLFLLFITFLLDLNGASLSDKYFYAKKNYATAVVNTSKKKEIKYLKQLILYGSKLHKDVSKYKKELYKLDKSAKYIEQKTIYKKKIQRNNKYTIKKIYTSKNQIVIDFTHNISKKYLKFSEYKKSAFYYDQFDIKGNFKDAKPIKLTLDGIDRILVLQYRYKTLRISLRNRYNTKSIYIINKNRLIIKVFPKKQKTKNLSNKKLVKIIKNKKQSNILNSKVIVIDPGHGGKDSGAVGPRRRYEKDIVLKISKYLYYELKKKGFKVYLTRDSDRYLKLTKRTRFANKKKADIFISIHANSVPKRNANRAKGIETYFLSPARSERAKRIAAKENSADMKILAYSSRDIVLNLLNRGKITASQKMAIDIQSHMLYNLKKYYGKNILDNGVREGPFWVLVGAQMPSVLIEIGYISHPIESKMIYSLSYQKRVAHGIANGVLSYFSKN